MRPAGLQTARGGCRTRSSTVQCSAFRNISQQQWVGQLQTVVATGAAAVAMNLLAANLVHAAYRLPPIDTTDTNRCARGYVGNTIGQANAVSDKTLDMRQCDYKGADLRSKVLAGALMEGADLSNTNLQEAVLTKAIAVRANFENADMTNAVIDRVVFDGANLRNVKFNNAVVTGATFADADLTDSNWEDALVGGEDVKRLCLNKSLNPESRLQVGCRQGKS